MPARAGPTIVRLTAIALTPAYGPPPACAVPAVGMPLYPASWTAVDDPAANARCAMRNPVVLSIARTGVSGTYGAVPVIVFAVIG